MQVDIAEYDTLDDVLLSMSEDEVLDAVVDLSRDGLWNSVSRPDADEKSDDV